MTDDLISNLRMVLSSDPALDLRQMDLRAYLETRDPALVRITPGVEPSWFEVRALDIAEMSTIKGMTGLSWVPTAVQCGLVSFAGPLAGAGVAARPTKDKESIQGRRVPVWDIRDVDALYDRIGWDGITELALLIVERAERGNAARGGKRFTLPPQSQPVLARNAALRAEQTREESATPT